MDAVQAWRGRGVRLVLAGVVLGIAVTAAVATRGLTETVRYQVADSFDSLAATQVVLDAAAGESVPAQVHVRPDRVRALTGVEASGGYVSTRDGGSLLARSRLPGSEIGIPRRVVGVDGDLLAAVGCGRNYVPDRPARVVWLGSAAAGSVGLGVGNIGERLRVDGMPYTFSGVIPPCPRMPALNSAIIMPLAAARAWVPTVDAGHLVIRTDVGAALGVALAAPLALSPTEPGLWSVSPPPDPRRARRRVDDQLAIAGLSVAALMGVVGALSVTAAMGSVAHDRAGELGLRRAMGATRPAIAALVLADCVLLGAASAAAGALGGIGVVLFVSQAQGWVPVVDLQLLGLTLVAAPALAVLAGLVPGVRAARLDPVRALGSR